jgi:hypothetical protein
MPTTTPTATPSPSGASSASIGSLYGGVSQTDQDVNAGAAFYKDVATTPVDEAGIRSNVMQGLQSEIDATNSIYAQKLAEAQRKGANLSGGTTALDARRGLTGSDFGAADQYNTATKNAATYSGIDADRQASIAAIIDKGNTEATNEITQKQNAQKNGADSYISFLNAAQSRQQTRTTNAAQAALSSGIDLSSAPDATVKAIADSYQIDPAALVSAYVSSKNALAQTQATLQKPVALTAGAAAYGFNPKTGVYEQLPGTGVSDAVSQAIADGRLDPSQVTRYNIGAISNTLSSDPTHDFITGKQTLLNSTSYTKDAYGNIVPLQKFPNVPVASTGAAKLPTTGASSEGGSTSFPKANAASLQQQQIYADSTQRAFNTANANLKALIPFMQTAGVNNNSTVPIINALQNKVKAGAADPGTIAAFQAAIAGLRAEYAQVLSRGGEVTDGQRNAAATLIPDDLTPAQLQQVADRLNIEGTNAVNEANAQIQTIKNRVNGLPTNTDTGESVDINALRAKYNY